jgi:hypothetical protein
MDGFIRGQTNSPPSHQPLNDQFFLEKLSNPRALHARDIPSKAEALKQGEKGSEWRGQPEELAFSTRKWKGSGRQNLFGGRSRLELGCA